MATDPFAQSESPSTPSLPSLGGGASSLAQSARLKQLNHARGWLIFVGLITIAANVLFMGLAKTAIQKEIDKQLAAEGLNRNSPLVDKAMLQELEDSALRTTRLFQIGYIGMGVVFLIGAALIKSYPVPVTILSLTLYIGGNVITAITEPELVAKGIILKIIIIVALVKAVQAAIAYQKELNSKRLAEFG